MDRIGPTDTAAFVDALRRVGRRPSDRAGVAGAERKGAADIRETLARLVADVDPENDEAMARARLGVLRAILARDWGAEAERDSAFAAMVEAVDRQIASDAALRQMFRDAVLALRK